MAMTQILTSALTGPSVLAGCLALLLPSAALAQAIDYRSLSDMFGEPVTVSATGKPQRASEAPVNLTIITADQLARLPATDLAGLLRFQPGLEVRRLGRGQSEVGLRGYNSLWGSRLLVLVDGRQVYLDSYGYTSWNTIPVVLSDIQQIEIVKGPTGALYGFNAISGVINIVTRAPQFEPGTSVDVEVGSHRHRQISARSTIPVGPGALKLTAASRRSQEFGDESSEKVVFASPIFRRFKTGEVGIRRDMAAADLQLPIGERANFGLDGSALRLSQYEIAQLGVAGPALYELVHLRAHGDLDTDHGLFSASAYINRYDFRQPIVQGTRNPFTVSQDLMVGTLNATLQPAPGQTLRLAAEARHSALTPNREWFRFRLGIDPAEISTDIVSLSSMYDWAVNDSIRLNAAVRLDRLSLDLTGDSRIYGGLLAPATAGPIWTEADFDDRTIVEPSFNVGMIWTFSPQNRLRINYGRAAQPPTLIEFGYVDPNQGQVGNPYLDPSRVTALEVSYDWTWPGWGMDGRAAVFRGRTEGIKTLSVSRLVRTVLLPSGNASPQSQQDSLGDSDTQGAELTLSGRRGPWHWQLGWSWQTIDDQFRVDWPLTDTDPSDGVYANGGLDYESGQPRHRIDASLGWQQGAWSLDLHSSWHDGYQLQQSATTGDRDRRLPSGFTSALVLSWAVSDRVTLQLIGDDLGRINRRESGAPAQRIEPSVTVRARFRL